MNEIPRNTLTDEEAEDLVNQEEQLPNPCDTCRWRYFHYDPNGEKSNKCKHQNNIVLYSENCYVYGHKLWFQRQRFPCNELRLGLYAGNPIPKEHCCGHEARWFEEIEPTTEPQPTIKPQKQGIFKRLWKFLTYRSELPSALG